MPPDGRGTYVTHREKEGDRVGCREIETLTLLEKYVSDGLI